MTDVRCARRGSSCKLRRNRPLVRGRSPRRLSMASVPPSKVARLFALALVCLANFSCSFGHYGNGNDQNDMNGRGRYPPHHPAARRHPIADENSATSFYERHGLEPPPLLSRADGARRLTDSESESESDAADAELDLLIKQTKSGTDPATLLRRDLIRAGGYDRHAYPWDYPWSGQSEGERTGVPVEFSLNLHRVFSVDVVRAVMDVIVWMRIEWTDPRLTWRPEEYGNLTKTWFWIGEGGAGGEMSEIWTPDIELWNLEEGLSDSFDDAYAIVNHDGSIFWSRPGHLRPACKFAGLDAFPFDTLTCSMEFGSWAYSGKYLRLVKGGGTGFSIGGSETAGASYNEFSFADEDPVECRVHAYPPYPGSPEEDWPVILYTVTVVRSWQPYARGYILTQVILNIVGFSAFWLPPSCGERIGLSITAMLAAVTAEIVVAENMPAAAEYTWIQEFSLLSMSFACIALLESVAVLFFFYKRSDTVIPGWYPQIKKWFDSNRGRKQGSGAAGRAASGVSGKSDRFAKKLDSFGSATSSKKALSLSLHANSFAKDEDDFFENGESFGDGKKHKIETATAAKRDDLHKVGDAPIRLDDGVVIETGKSLGDSFLSNLSWDGNGPTETRHESKPSKTDKDEAKKAEFTEGPETLTVHDNLRKEMAAKRVDGQYAPSIQAGNSRKRGSSLQDSITSDDLSFEGKLKKQELKPSRVHAHGRRRVTFSGEESARVSCPPRRTSAPNVSKRALMMQEFRDSNQALSVAVPRDADDFNTEEEIEHNKRWKHIAARIDDVARFWIPFSFFLGLSIVLSQVA